MAMPLASTTRKGVTLSFGAINLMVNVHSAVGDDTARKLKNVCTGHIGGKQHAPSPIKQRRYCPVCDNDNSVEFRKAQEVSEGYVMIPQEIVDLEKEAATGMSKGMEITMHPVESVSGMLPSGKSYYLSLPNSNPGQRQAYTMLSHLIRTKPDLAFMTRFTLRTAVSVFQITTAGPGTLVLRQMADAELVREHPAIEWFELTEQQMMLAAMVTDMEVKPFVPGEHGTGKSNIIANYAAEQTPIPGVEPVLDGRQAPTGGVVDITTQLEAMLAARGAQAPAVTPVKAPRKTAARKTAAKKTTTPRQRKAS